MKFKKRLSLVALFFFIVSILNGIASAYVAGLVLESNVFPISILLFPAIITGIITLFFLSLMSDIILVKILGFGLKKEGSFDIESNEYFLWVAGEVSKSIFIDPIRNFFPKSLTIQINRLIGLKIGKVNFWSSSIIKDPQMIEIGDNCILGHDAMITAHSFVKRTLYIKSIKIGNNVTIGMRAIILPGVEIGDNSIVACNSVVTSNTIIPKNEIWGGIPAKKIKKI